MLRSKIGLSCQQNPILLTAKSNLTRTDTVFFKFNSKYITIMPKIRYSAKENKRVGTHSYYAQAIPTGKLSFRELCEEACE